MAQVGTTFQDIFGDFVCGILHNIKDFWSEYGFMDMPLDDRVVVDGMFSIVKSNIHLTLDTDENDVDLQQEEHSYE